VGHIIRGEVAVVAQVIDVIMNSAFVVVREYAVAGAKLC
jgi:hypothetical protein